MKLLEKLRTMSSSATLVESEPQQEELEHPYYLLQDEPELTEDETFGVGAAMPQDVMGFNLLDGFRRVIPDIHEECPPQGLSCVD